MEYTHFLLLFGVGTVAGFINVMAGGGSSITLPALIFLGLDGALANGTNRIAIFIQNIFAISSFRQKKVHQFKNSFLLALWTLPGAVVGALVAVRISDEWFRDILAVVMLGIVVSMFFTPAGKSGRQNVVLQKKPFLIYPVLLAIGFYGGFLQVGVGFLFMASFYHILKLNLVHVNMHKVFIIFMYTIPALAIFIYSGNVNWGFGLSLAAGNAFGGWWSAQLAVKKGDRFIRIILAVAILIMALKLFQLF